MRRMLLAVPAAILCASAETVNVERLKADVAFLASEPLAGRRALERGADVAAQFIVAEFRKAGLQPAAAGAWLQPFELLEYRMDAEATRIVLRGGAREQVLVHGRDFSGAFPRPLTIRAPVVFAGYGITAPEYGYDDYAGLDVRGKVVVVFELEPRAHDPASPFHGEGNTVHASPRRKLLNAQDRGAVAVLVIPAPNRKRPYRPGRGGRVQALTESEARIPMLTLSVEAAGALLEPSGRRPADLQAALDESMKPLRVPLQLEAEIKLAPAESRRGVTNNVAGVLEGSDPRLRQQTVILCAHYDHLGTRDGKVLPGADDNASGVAALLELARMFTPGPPPRRSLLFIAFGAEEAGLLGSYHYVAHPLRPLPTTRAVINLDMIGRDEKPSEQTEGLVQIASDTSNELNLVGIHASPGLRAIIEEANKAVGLRLNDKWDRDGTLNVLWRCDHFPFLLRGIPAVWLFNGFTPDYHTPEDTPDKLDYAKMERIVRLAWRAAQALANRDDWPRFGPTGR
ncbi:MAG: M28 family peptidase [Bryobacteraceae bacterium]